MSNRLPDKSAGPFGGLPADFLHLNPQVILGSNLYPKNQADLKAGGIQLDNDLGVSHYLNLPTAVEGPRAYRSIRRGGIIAHQIIKGAVSGYEGVPVISSDDNIYINHLLGTILLGRLRVVQAKVGDRPELESVLNRDIKDVLASSGMGGVFNGAVDHLAEGETMLPEARFGAAVVSLAAGAGINDVDKFR